MSFFSEDVLPIETPVQIFLATTSALASTISQANSKLLDHQNFLTKLTQTQPSPSLITPPPFISPRQAAAAAAVPSGVPLPECSSIASSFFSAGSSSASANFAPSIALLQASVTSANNAFNSIRDSAAAALSTASSSLTSASNAAAAASSSAASAIASAKSSANSAISSANQAAQEARNSGSNAVQMAMSSVSSVNQAAQATILASQSAQAEAQNTTKFALAITFAIIGSSLLSILAYYLISRYRSRRREKSDLRLLGSNHSPSSSRSQPVSVADSEAHSRSRMDLERERAKTRQSIARDRARSVFSERDFGAGSSRRGMGSRDTAPRKSLGSRETMDSVSQFPLPRGRVLPPPPLFLQTQAQNQMQERPRQAGNGNPYEQMQQRELEARKTWMVEPHPGERSALNPELARIQTWLKDPGVKLPSMATMHPLRRNPSLDFIPPERERRSIDLQPPRPLAGVAIQSSPTTTAAKGKWSAFPSLTPTPRTPQTTARELEKVRQRAEERKRKDSLDRPRSRKTMLTYDPERPGEPPRFETMWVDDPEEEEEEEEEEGSATLLGTPRARTGTATREEGARIRSASASVRFGSDGTREFLLSPKSLATVSEGSVGDSTIETVMSPRSGKRRSDSEASERVMGGWLKEGMMSPRAARRASDGGKGGADSPGLPLKSPKRGVGIRNAI